MINRKKSAVLFVALLGMSLGVCAGQTELLAAYAAGRLR